MTEEKKCLIDAVVETEWNMFGKVRNISGRAECQDNRKTFEIMRRSQFESWSEKLLVSYLADLQKAEKDGRNMLTEKYAYMMEYTNPEEFLSVKDRMPRLSPEKKVLVKRITDRDMENYDRLAAMFPSIAGRGRPKYSSQETNGYASVESYMLGELSSYSYRTLKIYEQYQDALFREGKSIPCLILENTMKKYGFSSLEEAEQWAGMDMKKRNGE
jgi:hypothetical protein